MILMNAFKAESAEMRQAMMEAVRRVLESGWYVLGNELQTFENKWAGVCGVPHTLGVANGMDAIEIALRALDIGAGDEVVTTPMTAFATVLAIYRAGATPVLADIDPNTGLLSIESVSRCISAKTKAIILVHLYGQVRDMSSWLEFCNKHKIELIEDCAQAHLAKWDGRVAGSFGAAGAYSFYPTKNLGAPGDAGALVTKRPEIAKRAASLRNYGQTVRYHHPELGMNSRLDEIHAAILLERLKWLDDFTKRRLTIAAAYRAGINHPAVQHLISPEYEGAHVYHLFVVKCTKRDALQMHLGASDIQALIHYPIPVHMQESCKLLRCDPIGLTQADQYGRECLSLPCHPQMSDQDVDKVIRSVNAFKG